jgi:hypothetical protein
LSDLPDPTPNIVLMGDFNFQDKHLSWVRSEDGILVPLVHGHRQSAAEEGQQVRQQAARLVELALKHNLIQQVDQVTHGREILDLLFSNNEDLVSSVAVEPWPSFTDHSIVKASVSFKLEAEKDLEETHLLESGKRLKKLNFNKAPWPEIQKQLKLIDWEQMKAQAKESPSAALSLFMDMVIPILESLVPLRSPRRKKRSKLERKRKLIWRKLGKVQRNIESSSSLSRLSKLIQDRWELEKQLKAEYSSLNQQQEDDALLNLKENPKSFFSFARSRQKTRARIGPFLDPVTGIPNPDPDFASSVLSEQYKSVFVKARPEWTVDNPGNFLASTEGENPVLTDIKYVHHCHLTKN